MAGFEQAIKWLKEGKKVRRPSWKEDSYWKPGEDESIQWVTGQAAHIHLNQISAEDWEIYEEDKKINALIRAIKILQEGGIIIQEIKFDKMSFLKLAESKNYVKLHPNNGNHNHAIFGIRILNDITTGE